MKKIKVGLIGYGLSGAIFHAPFLKASEKYEIVKVMSSNQEKVQKDLGDVQIVDSLEKILEDQEVELVVITTPNTLHYDMAKKSLLHQKHVIIEKPMVIDLKEGQELIQLAKEKNVMLSAYQNRRWDGDFLTIKDLIEKGALGEVSTYEARYDRFRPEVRDRWREKPIEGSGMLYDLGSHLIDQALHLFGVPQFVMADVFAQREGSEVDDYFHVVLGYERLRVILHSGSIVKEQGAKYKVHGSKGSYIKYGSDVQEGDLLKGKSPLDADWGRDHPDQYGHLFTEKDGEDQKEVVETLPGSYLTYYEKVHEHIRQGKPCPVPAEEALKTIEMIHAAFQSSKEKRVFFLHDK